MTDPTIDKAALEAAIKAYDEQSAHSVNWGALRAAIRAYLAALPPTTGGVRVTYRHKKRGSEYVLIGVGRMQAAGWLEVSSEPGIGLSVDMREVAIYRSVDDGSLWVRPREEFEDGRFEAIEPARIMASLNISEAEPESVLLESACRTLMTKIYNRGHSGLDLDCPLCQAYIAVDRLLAWETGAAPSEEVLAWDRRASPTTSPLAPEGVRDDVLAVLERPEVIHALEIGRMGRPYSDVQGYLYMAEQYRGHSSAYAAQFTDHGLAHAACVLFNAADDIIRALKGNRT